MLGSMLLGLMQHVGKRHKYSRTTNGTKNYRKVLPNGEPESMRQNDSEGMSSRLRIRGSELSSY